MRKPGSVESLEALGRVRLSKSFFMRDFLYSEIANFYGIPNFPDDPDMAIEAGRMLCEEVLEPIQERLGRISIRSAYRSCAVNARGIGRHNCASNEANYGGHIWDRPKANGEIGATACIVVNSFIPYYERTGHWEALAWWIFDQLGRGTTFYPKLAAFNINSRKSGGPTIYSYVSPQKGCLTQPGYPNFKGNHADEYQGWLDEISDEVGG